MLKIHYETNKALRNIIVSLVVKKKKRFLGDDLARINLHIVPNM